MASSFQEIFGGFAFTGLMVLALFGMIITIQANNDAAQPLIDEALFNNTYSSLNSTIGDLQTTSKTQYNLFSSEKPVSGFGSIVLFTVVSVGKTFSALVFTLFTIIIKIPLIVLGIDPTIPAMILSFLTITTIIAVWIIYKFGG